MTPKMYDKCISYVIGHKFINPMGVGLNSTLILTQYVVRFVSIVFNNLEHLYASLLPLEIDLLSLSMCVGLKLPPSTNPKCG